MSKIVVCMDCPSYEKGGWCRLHRKTIGSLWPACKKALEINSKFNPEDTPPENMESMTTPTPQPTKTCTKCGEVKPQTEFYKNAKAADGLKSWCKHCHSLAAAETARKARAEKRANKQAAMKAEEAGKLPQPKTVVVRDVLTDQQMVDLLREHGWTVKCYRTITEEL